MGKLAFTIDSFVVKLAFTGTVHNLAVCGALPAFLSPAFIIEEGLLIAAKATRRFIAFVAKKGAGQVLSILQGREAGYVILPIIRTKSLVKMSCL